MYLYLCRPQFGGNFCVGEARVYETCNTQVHIFYYFTITLHGWTSHVHTHTYTHRDTHTHTHTYTDTHTHTDTQTHRHTDTPTHTHSHIPMLETKTI